MFKISHPSGDFMQHSCQRMTATQPSYANYTAIQSGDSMQHSCNPMPTTQPSKVETPCSIPTSLCQLHSMPANLYATKPTDIGK